MSSDTYAFEAFYESDSHDDDETPIINLTMSGPCITQELRLTIDEVKELQKALAGAIKEVGEEE